MTPNPTPPDPSLDELRAEVEVLRQKVKELEQAKQDLDVMLEMATEHADGPL